MQFRINGKIYKTEANPSIRLIDLLRNVFGLTGTKEGCGEGECGACTVIVNGKAVNSCLVLAGQVQDAEIITIEGLSTNGEPGRLQQAFIDSGAVQCGFCTPGMILSAKALLDNNPYPSDEEIKVALSGNLCRCTGYAKIITAVRMVCGEYQL
jgi:carbon-monoxide dehydrogenase small subunit